MRGPKTRLFARRAGEPVLPPTVLSRYIVGPVRLTFSENRGASLPRPVQATATALQPARTVRQKRLGGLRWPPTEPSVRAGASERLPSHSCSTGRLWQTRH